MVKSLMIRDDVYERLSRLKKNGESFSDVITRLLDTHVEAVDSRELLHVLHGLESKVNSLETAVGELRELLSRRSFSFSDTSIPVTRVSVTKKEKLDKSLPSFLQDNPWVEVLENIGRG